MKRFVSMRLRLCVLAGPIALLAACAGAPTRIHTLDATPPASPVPIAQASTSPPFRIDAVHIPPAFDRPELIRRTEPYTLTLSDTDRWAAPLGDLIRRTLTQDLAERLPAGVVVYPDAPKPATAQGLVVDILSIAPIDQGIAMDVSWTWVEPKVAVVAPSGVAVAATPAVSPANVAHLLAPIGGTGPSAIAPEISALLGQLADRIAAGR